MRDRPLLSEGAGDPFPGGLAQYGYPLVLAGGFSCQDISVAGRNAGLDGERTGLWREFIRAVSVVRPDFVVAENVGHTWRKWVPELRRQLSLWGYTSLPLRVRARDLGAPHLRARIIVVAHADRLVLRELSRWWVGEGRQVAKELGQSWNQEPGVPRMDDGVPNRVERNHAIGNAVSPLIVQVIARGIRKVTQQDTSK